MRVNGFLAQVSGVTKVKLFDTRCTYVNDMSVNEYFDEEYDKSFVDYDIKSVSVQDSILFIKIKPADKSQLADRLETIREQLDALKEDLDDFEEYYL